MKGDFSAARAFIAVATAGGFREAAKISDMSASSLSGAVRRLEDQLGVRLLNRTTRSVTTTEAGAHLLHRLQGAMLEMEAALESANEYRGTPSGTLRLNVPLGVARLVLPRLLPGFSKAYPDVRVEIIAEYGIVDILVAGCDAGIRYDDKVTKNMVLTPIGPSRQRFATAASPAYLARHGYPLHPQDLDRHACLPAFVGGGHPMPWEFEKEGEIVRVEVQGPATVDVTAVDLAVSMAVDGCGIVHLYEEWLQPQIDSGVLVPVLEPWWQSFDGPLLFYHGREHVPAPLRAFVEYLCLHRW